MFSFCSHDYRPRRRPAPHARPARAFAFRNQPRSGAYDGLYGRADKLLRELENPNLHDIANMSFRVELWDRHALHIRWVVAAAGSVFVARAAFDAAVKHWPDQKAT